MATIPIDVPNAIVTEIMPVIDARLTERGIDIAGMTVAARGKRYLAELVKDLLVEARTNAARTSVATTIDDAITQARTDADTIT